MGQWFKIRLGFVYICFVAFFILIGLRLFQLQLWRDSGLEGLAQRQYLKVNKKVQLYTSDGNVGTHFMCFNKSSYDEVLSWDLIKQKDLFDWYVNSKNRFKFLEFIQEQNLIVKIAIVYSL
jgi:hypothetical protein